MYMRPDHEQTVHWHVTKRVVYLNGSTIPSRARTWDCPFVDCDGALGTPVYATAKSCVLNSVHCPRLVN